MPRPPARMTARLDIIDLRIVTGEVFGLAEPFDGFAQTLLQTRLRLEAGQLSNTGIVAMKPLHFAVRGAQPFFGRFRSPVRLRPALRWTCDIADGDFRVRADIHRLAGGGLAARQRQEPRAGVSDVVEIPRRAEATQPDAAHAGQ